MHANQDYLVGLAQLHTLGTDEEKRAAWRQGLAALGAAVAQQPTPLEGVSTQGLVAGVRAALASGFADDLAWLSKPVAAVALFELAGALPHGREKRELGRRVLKALNDGDAATFASLARSLALGSRRVLSGAGVRARVALCLRLPMGAGVGVDALALALISRPELEREWLTRPSTESLPSRRLAAQLVERAAREVARRAREGDDGGVRVFERPSVRAAWGRLLADGDSLVWRHVATARGLLLAAVPAFAEEVERGLSPRQPPGEWRRAAASLAASVAHDSGRALARCRELVAGDLCRRSPSLKVAMVHGLSRAAEEEPEAADELLHLLVKGGEIDVVEALVELRQEHGSGDFGARTAAAVLARLRASSATPDDGLTALRRAIAEDLAPETAAGARSLTAQLNAALLAFTEGRDLRPLTEAALGTARALVDDLEAAADETPAERQRALRALRALDRGLLETSTLSDLMTVCGIETPGASGGSGPVAAAATASGPAPAGGGGMIGGLLARLQAWICKQEAAPLTSGEVPHVTLRLRRLRTLLHVLDTEGSASDEAAADARDRRLRTFRLLLDRVDSDPPSPLRRTTCAAVARACDALVRGEVCELSDVLVAVSTRVRRADDLAAVAEAAMVPELREPLRAAAEVARLVAAKPDRTAERTFVHAFRGLADALPTGISPHVEGLRRALVGIARALPRIHGATSLAALEPGGEKAALEPLEKSLEYAARLCVGARRRLGLPAPTDAPMIGPAIKSLDVAMDHMRRDLDDDLGDAIAQAITAAHADLPAGIAAVVARALAPLGELPLEVPFDDPGDAPTQIQAELRLRLPDWLPPSRILGGFHVVRPIGSGAVGSVFVARRAEERHDDAAETYALKVPSFDGQNAHTLTEQEFMQLFREEAGALLTLPSHPNLAGFVTFDARARPKPILVMELVHGPTLERMLEKRELSVPIAFAVLDGIAAGLGAMHAGGVGHLDVKPGNVILRVPAGSSISRLVTMDAVRPTAVLVDFGLSGRKIRPGCASPYYGAPEVWDTNLSLGTDPKPADAYAFCCMAYELLVGRPLFLAETLPALIACHFKHEGVPAGLAALEADKRLAPLVEVLASGLAPRPELRASIGQLRDAIAAIAPRFERVGHWPLAA